MAKKKKKKADKAFRVAAELLIAVAKVITAVAAMIAALAAIPRD